MPPAPRPRPRPKPRVAEPAGVSPPSDPSSSVTPGISTSTPEDEDAQFIKNRSRTAKDWKKLGELSRESKLKVEVSWDDTTSEEEDVGESSPRRKHKKKTNVKVTLPTWARTNSLPRILSPDIDDNDSDIEEVALQDFVNTPTNRREKDKRKRRRSRSRSRSVTPPPALPIYQIQNARRLVREALGGNSKRAPSPNSIAIDPNEGIILDPELAKIAQQVSKQVHEVPLADLEQSSSQGAADAVILRVKWLPHPLKNTATESPWAFKMRRRDTLRALFDQIADMASVFVEDVVMSYDKKRVFASATPYSLNIWNEAQLEACAKATYEYIRANGRSERSLSVQPDLEEGSSHTDSPDAGSDDDSSHLNSGPTLKLIVRSAKTQDVTLTVRPTTTCGAIVQAFLKNTGLAGQYTSTGDKTPKKGKKSKSLPAPVLMVDGEKMAPGSEIGDADLEDGDLVEVVGL